MILATQGAEIGRITVPGQYITDNNSHLLKVCVWQHTPVAPLPGWQREEDHTSSGQVEDDTPSKQESYKEKDSGNG